MKILSSLLGVFLFFGIGFSAFSVWETRGDEKSENEDTPRYLLRYRYEKGEVLRWNVLQSLRITTAVRGKTERVETASRSTKIWTVVHVDDKGTATFEYQVEDVDMQHYKTGEDTSRYNSRKDKTIPPYFANLEGTIGVPLARLTIDTRGEMKGKTALRDYSAQNKENQIAVPLPEKPIAVGENWTIDMPIEIKQPNGTVKKISARQKFTLQSVRTGIARVEFVTQVLTPLDPKEKAQILDKYSNGQLTLDLDAGHVVSQQLITDERVVGFQGTSDNIHHFSRLDECCCGLKSCEICNPPDGSP